jgi:hypothetical protein
MLSQHDRILDGHYRVKIANELGIDYPRDVREVADDYEAQDLALTLQLGPGQDPVTFDVVSERLTACRAGTRWPRTRCELLGAGMHPLATQRLEQLGDAELTDANIQAPTRRGIPFRFRHRTCPGSG